MEKTITVVPNKFLLRGVCLPLFLLITISYILTLIKNGNDHVITAVVCPIIGGLFLLMIFLPYLLRDRDTFTSEGVIRKRGKKVIWEVKWDNVEMIGYIKIGVLSSLFLMATSCIIYCKEDIEDRDYPVTQIVKHVRTSFTYKEFKKIQAIIPIVIKSIK